MEMNLVAEALKFMVLGMGIVFMFLTIMIFVLKAQAKLIEKFFPEENKSATKTKEWQPANNNTSNEDVTAAITAAIVHHSKSNKKG